MMIKNTTTISFGANTTTIPSSESTATTTSGPALPSDDTANSSGGDNNTTNHTNISTEMPPQSHDAQRPDYYKSGSTAIATDTFLTINRLEARRALTKNSTRLVIVLVGLPARGKSFVARKLINFLEWYGCQCKIFNVGKYRRQAYAEATHSESGACNAEFFDSNNTEAAQLREQVAHIALKDMLRWLDAEQDGSSSDDGSDDEDRANNSNNNSSNTSGEGSATSSTATPSIYRGMEPQRDRIAIFDATNSTNKRRQWILEQCTSPSKRIGKPTGVVFVESLCDDQELLMENYRFKISNSPDYVDMEPELAMADLERRVKKYEEQYETITDDSLSYIKIFNLSTKLLVNHIYGRMSKVIVPALMAWNIGTRPIFLCRPGQTLSDITTDRDDYVTNVNLDGSNFMNLSSTTRRRLVRGDRLGPGGKKFSDALYDFVFEEAMDFTLKRASIMDMAATGTSISGLAKPCESFEPNHDAPFPLKIFTSTMPRAVETVRWEEFDFRVEEMSNLNPLDKGDFAGKELDEIHHTNPSWYSGLEKDPFNTRFPGGESYKDMISRLESVVVDLEQQVIPTLIVSHVSILQMLIAYFRRSPVREAMTIEVPLHTVLKFTPARGGGWTESQHELAPVYERTTSFLPSQNSTRVSIEGMDKVSSKQKDQPLVPPSPIWGDHLRRQSSASFNVVNPTGNYDHIPLVPTLRNVHA